eukprot:UN04034
MTQNLNEGYRISLTWRHAVTAESEVLKRSGYNKASSVAMSIKDGDTNSHTGGVASQEVDELTRFSRPKEFYRNQNNQQNNRQGNNNKIDQIGMITTGIKIKK